MRLIILLIFLSFNSIDCYSQAKLSLQRRVKEQRPYLYDTWTIDITESIIRESEFIIKDIKFSKDESALIEIESLLKQVEESFFDFDLFPLELSTITHYGKVEVSILNYLKTPEKKLEFNFLVSQFSTSFSIYLFPQGNDHGLGMMSGILDFIDDKGLLINTGRSIFKLNPHKLQTISPPKLMNNIKTMWNEGGLNGKVKEAVTKKYDIVFNSSEVGTHIPFLLRFEKYNKEGQMVYSKDSERDFLSERTLSGSFNQRLIKEFRSNQEITITTEFKMLKDSALGESFVDGKIWNKAAYKFTNGRLIQEKLINYLDEVEQVIDYVYYLNGQVYSISSAYVKQDMSDVQIFKYIKYDDHGNWTERIIYDGYKPRYFEIRALVYF
jgi:hypothetical protein